MAWGGSPTVGAWDSDEGSNVNLTPGAPSGSGGLLLLCVTAREASSTISTPTGWTSIASGSRSAILARVSDGGGNDTPTVNVTHATSTTCAAVISRWTGGNTTLGSLLNGAAQTAFTGATAGLSVPAVTPSVNNCLVLRGGHKMDDAGTFTASSGDTLLAELAVNLSADMNVVWEYRIQTTAGTAASASIANASNAQDGYSIGVALTEGVTTTKYVKILADSPAASATGVEVVVYSAPSGSNYITGTTRYGSANAQEFEASLESGNAVLKVLADDVGCGSLAAATTVAALARNTTYTTGMVEATIIEE